ncbi:hypothetical protein EWW49_33345 [Pseudomonas syringae]|nr:hypothetical protein EWW49_33345 [Pseudomonas syringae]
MRAADINTTLTKKTGKRWPSAWADAFENQDLQVTFLNAPMLCHEDHGGALVDQRLIKTILRVGTAVVWTVVVIEINANLLDDGKMKALKIKCRTLFIGRPSFN